jgi:HEAT repeat protein
VPSRVLEFFFFPLVIVAVGVAVFVLFGLVTSEGKGPRDYVQLIRTGDANRRWQAAFELSRVIRSGKDPRLQDPRLAAEMVALFEGAGTDDPRVRRFLALALGRLGSADAVPALRAYLDGIRRSGGEGEDPETGVYALWALGAIGAEAAVPELLSFAAHEDAGLRKTAVHSLGAFRTAEAKAALQAALEDAVGDVRWNAASALALQGDPAATPVLLQMLDRDELSRSGVATPQQAEGILLQAIAGARHLRDPRLEERLEALGRDDPSLRVRAAARRGLEDAAGGPGGAGHAAKTSLLDTTSPDSRIDRKAQADRAHRLERP